MKIHEAIGLPALLGQVAEEAAELSQSVLKLQRILMGTNPTPVTEAEARASIVEEATDIQVCLEALSAAGVVVFDPEAYLTKLERWRDRLTSGGATNG